jgi:manganese oxidase
MMTGTGQFGPIEMGGMFTVMKVREGMAANDYKDPGPYQFPPGAVAHEVEVADAGAPQRQPGASDSPKKETPKMDMKEMDMPGMDMKGMKHDGHN